MMPANWRPFSLGLNEVSLWVINQMIGCYYHRRLISMKVYLNRNLRWMAWVSNYKLQKPVVIITYPYHNFIKSVLVDPSATFGLEFRTAAQRSGASKFRLLALAPRKYIMTSRHGNIGPLWGESASTVNFPDKRSVMRPLCFCWCHFK